MITSSGNVVVVVVVVSSSGSSSTASIRIPWQVEVDKKGYLEDRRPNANADPYVIATVMIDTVCSAASS